MVGVGVGEDERANPAGGDAVRGDIAHQRLDIHAGTGVDQGRFVAAIHQVDVAIIEVGDANAGSAAADHIDIVEKLHSVVSGPSRGVIGWAGRRNPAAARFPSVPVVGASAIRAFIACAGPECPANHRPQD